MNTKSFFLCIGAQKAGTTWLYRNLKNQHNIWLSPKKEIHYFDRLYLAGHREKFNHNALLSYKNTFNSINLEQISSEDYQLLNWYARFALTTDLTDDWYLSLFPQAENIVCGEITPAYALLPIEGFAHIKKLIPDIKIVFIMRNPIERTWSQIRFYAQQFNQPQLLTAEEAIAFSNTEECELRCRYDQTIINLESIFSPEQIGYFYYEAIFQQPQFYLTQICQFIGCELTNTDLINQIIFNSETHTMPKALNIHLKQKYAYLINFLQKKGQQLPASWI